MTCALSLACMSIPLKGICADNNPKPFVVPELSAWQGGTGSFEPSGRIVAKGGKSARQVAILFAENYKLLTGRTLTVVNGSKMRQGDFVFQLDRTSTFGEEGYSLDIGTWTTLRAAGPKGMLWGASTLLQLSEQSENGQLACGVATDAPKYKLRGFVIDCGRKYIPMSYLRNLVKVMSYYKMNTLQVHLNDNGFRQYFDNDWAKTQAAFRLECDTYPGLTAKDGSYSKAEFIAFQQLAETYGVEIIPEIDIPAHSLAFAHYRPSLGSKEFGMDHLDLSSPATYAFCDSLLSEYLGGKNPVFRGHRMHIGTDEYSNQRQDVVEQFRAFTDHYIRLVERYGKEAAVWGALTHAKGKTPVKADNVLMNCWYNGYADPVEMKRLGYELISIPDGWVYIVPAAGYYNDWLDTRYLYENWTPARIGSVRFEEGDKAVAGGMFAVWNDHAGNGITVKDIHARIMPALQTVAAKCWSGAATSVSYAEFDSLRLTLSEAPGVNEAGRLPQSLHRAEVMPGETADVVEVGYDYRVSFTVDAVEESKGCVLFSSPSATFYLSDPATGKIGFSRDSCYYDTFNYRLPVGKKVRLTVEGDREATRLYVDGVLREELKPQTLHVFTEACRMKYPEQMLWQPVVSRSTAQMRYVRTLVFPLQQAGHFKSKVTDLSVEQKVK